MNENDAEADKLTIRRLCDELIFPRLTYFFNQTLQPLLLDLNLDVEKVYTPDSANYVAITTPTISANELIGLFGRL